MENNLVKKYNFTKTHKIIIAIILGVLFFGATVFGSYKYFDSQKLQKANIIKSFISEVNYENCENVFNENIENLEKNKYISSNNLKDFLEKCNEDFNIKNLKITFDNCEDIVSSNSKNDLVGDFLVLDSYEEIKKTCISNFQELTFSTGSFFDVEDDFKTTIFIDFKIPFFTDLDDNTSDEFLQNRDLVKQKLIDDLEIVPSVENLKIDDIVLSQNKATLYLNLKPLTEYKIKSKTAKIIEKKQIEEKIENKSENGGVLLKEKIKEKYLKNFVFTTPEKKYLGIKVENPVSLYTNTNLPKFKILDYKSGKNNVNIKICKIDEETYSKIEILKARLDNDFFINKLQDLKTFSCETKNIVLREKEDKTDFIKKDFNFDDKIKENGFYYVTFLDKQDTNFNSRTQQALLFGVINSHITMKISKKSEVFFFVNDFEGNPLSGQNISIFINDFVGKEKNWNETKKDYDEKKFSVLDNDILDKPIDLGITGKDGILKVNLKDKVPEAFYKTFVDNWEYEWSENYNAFYIKSQAGKYLSYNNSKWNSGIAPWNFGYKIGGNYGENNYLDNINLDIWGEQVPNYYSHTYTDRVLYLPNEEVNFKTIVRKTQDLTIEKDKQFNVIISDSNSKEIYNKNLKINNFGSFSDNLKLDKNSPLGFYTISVRDGDKQISYSTFSVEVFKNPNFKTDITMQTSGLESGNVKIDNTKKINFREEEYNGKFILNANISSKYYAGAILKNAKFTYKIYKQAYYENSWWDDCFYGCYWDPEKEFYSSGEGILDELGNASISANIGFKSNYNDYKYILEVSVTDSAGDRISSSNSIIAKLPDEFKKWDNNQSLTFTTENKFYKVGENIKITGTLSSGSWTKYFDNKYLFIIKKKNYINKKVLDVRGKLRNINKVEEKLVDILFVNSKKFKINADGKLELDYKIPDSGEYVFEYSKINSNLKLADNENIYDIVKKFKQNSGKNIKVNQIEGEKNIVNKDLELDNLLDYSKKYFTLLGYGDSALNPIIDDNKLYVYSEKTVYKPGEIAKVLIRLPFSKGKILWTIEKDGVIKSEYIDVSSNIFFKEFLVDDTFIPNAYIGVIAVEVDNKKVPEYKVGYTEIVVDKADKKSFINIKSNKKTYSPREEVSLDFEVKDFNKSPLKSELSVMVVDDSLISLMGNIDLNLIDKFYKKLDFSIQTSLTNLAMLRNYYFSRPGIVGGSGAGNFKGGDSAVSSRNIFKNTAYYNASVITDENGKANIKFNLPDNLTNFRIIVVSNSIKNFFGVSESFIEVRKNILVEPKTPLILRDNDSLKIGANIFNNTKVKKYTKVLLNSTALNIKDKTQNIEINPNSGKFVEFDIKNTQKCKKDICEIDYTISALGDNVENSDKYEGTIENKKDPVFIQNYIKSAIVKNKNLSDIKLQIPENTDILNSQVELTFSNTRLVGIEKILKSLEAYPYGCIEQTASSTLPNAILLKFSDLIGEFDLDKQKIENNLNYGIDRILSMQNVDGGFSYWPGETNSDEHISPYVIRSLIEMQKIGVKIDEKKLDLAISYLVNNFKNFDITAKFEIFWTLAKYDKNNKILDELENINSISSNLSRHDLIVYTYAMILTKKNKYKTKIEENIENIKKILNVDNKESYWFWDKYSDKAIFTSMLIDYNYNFNYIDSLILDLYSLDFESYYYSTQTKNNSFLAFEKFLEKYSKNNSSTFEFSIGKELNKEKLFYIGGKNKNIIKFNYKLADILYGNNLNLKAFNLSGEQIYIDLILKQYPKDVEKIKAYSAGVEIKREIYEIIDFNKLDECENALNSYYNRGRNIGDLVECKGVYALKTDNIFKKGNIYKNQIIVKFPDEKYRRNLVIEDYLASSFRVLNSKFKTESAIITKNTSGNDRNWDHTEFNKGVVFANTSYVYSDILNFNYYFVPEFSGNFTLPASTTYMMYNPLIRANSEFKKIEVVD